ncbi:hypothetical protein [Amycolatopsis anabasis]|uniref:hypothetical protein n=1 Tax=Amycolatopsis anabasis TaxID=1840409 RepID=UPI00131E85DB|nr:hypothetical protein [Amycolatopsis anabasis]
MPDPATQPSSRTVALAVAAANLVLCAAVGVTLLVVRAEPDNDDPAALPGLPVEETIVATRSETSKPTRSRYPTRSTSAPAVPDGFRRASGPGNLTTVVPIGWDLENTGGPNTVQATDPADSRRVFKFGGGPVDGKSILDSHVEYERQVAQRSGYALQELREATLRGHEAVVWEFEWDAPEGRRHVRSVYWRTGGIEYFVYAAAPVESWSATQPLHSTMIENARP